MRMPILFIEKNNNINIFSQFQEEELTDESSDNTFVDLIEMVKRNRSEARSIVGDHSNRSQWTSMRTSTPLRELASGSGVQFRSSYLAVSEPHLDPEVGAMPHSPQPFPVNDENSQQMNDISHGEEQQIVQQQPSFNIDNTNEAGQPILSPIAIAPLEEAVTRRPRRNKVLQIDQVKVFTDAQLTAQRANTFIECAPTDLMGPVLNKLNQNKKLSDNCLQLIDRQRSHSILNAAPAKQSVAKDIRRLFNNPCMPSSRLNAPFFQNLRAQSVEDVDESIMNSILGCNPVNRATGQGGGGFADQGEMPENAGDLTNYGDNQMEAMFVQPALPGKKRSRSFRRVSTSTRNESAVDDSENNLELSYIHSANAEEELDDEVVPRKIPRRTRFSAIQHFPTINEESPHQG